MPRVASSSSSMRRWALSAASVPSCPVGRDRHRNGDIVPRRPERSADAPRRHLSPFRLLQKKTCRLSARSRVIRCWGRWKTKFHRKWLKQISVELCKLCSRPCSRLISDGGIYVTLPIRHLLRRPAVTVHGHRQFRLSLDLNRRCFHECPSREVSRFSVAGQNSTTLDRRDPVRPADSPYNFECRDLIDQAARACWRSARLMPP